MKYFYVVVNKEKENAETGARLIQEYLNGHGCQCLRWEKKRSESGEYRYTDSRQVPEETECIIALGGDGTLIQAARDLAGRDIPLFGVNMGTLGYLTQISRECDIIPALDELIADHYRLEKRMMLCGRVISGGKEIASDIALNDIVLTRTGLYTLKFKLYLNGQLFNDYSADGMIIATPTGSTAYNLSAGGPIAAPESEMIILTPICPHTLNSRSIVVPSGSEITLELTGQGELEPFLSFDGDTAVRLRQGDRIGIGKSKIRTTLVQLKQVPFLENIRNKMKQI